MSGRRSDSTGGGTSRGRKPEGWFRKVLVKLGERRRRTRARAGAVPMRAHLLRDLGLVEADAYRLGLLP